MTKKVSSCSICGASFPAHALVRGETIRHEIINEIKHSHPQWDNQQFICHTDLARFRSRYVRSLLSAEKGELSSLDQTVLNSLNEQELLSLHLESRPDLPRTISEQLTDTIAHFGGSWWFISFFCFFLLAWIAVNSYTVWSHPSDPYPFIFLNLILSCVGAIQAPVIMMSQNRQETKDRMRSQKDYQINLKAELEIRHLHEKIDHLLTHQWEKMTQIQEIQLELLAELESNHALARKNQRQRVSVIDEV